MTLDTYFDGRAEHREALLLGSSSAGSGPVALGVLCCGTRGEQAGDEHKEVLHRAEA